MNFNIRAGEALPSAVQRIGGYPERRSVGRCKLNPVRERRFRPYGGIKLSPRPPSVKSRVKCAWIQRLKLEYDTMHCF